MTAPFASVERRRLSETLVAPYVPRHPYMFRSLKHHLSRSLLAPLTEIERMESVMAAGGYLLALHTLWYEEGQLTAATAREFYADFMEIKKFIEKEIREPLPNKYQEGVYADFNRLIQLCDKYRLR